MKILHVVPTYFPAIRYGGPIFSVHALARSLAKRGHEVDVFTTNVDGAGVSDVPLDRPVAIDQVNVQYFPVSWPRRLFRSPDFSASLARVVSDYTIVHLHSVFLWPTWAAARAVKKAKSVYVLSPRGMLIKSLIRSRSYVAKTVWIRLIERSNVEDAGAVHLTSDLEAIELDRFGWRLPKCAVIPNGIDEPLTYFEDVASDVREISAKQPLLLFLGRLSWKKGLDRLLVGFARTKAGSLVIVGTDDEGMAPQLSKLAAQLGITDRVKILPRTVNGADKEHLFAAADVFVLPSYSENFGNTVLEAMRRGVPVVTTPEVGAAEIVRQCGGGLVAEGNPESFSAAMDQLSQNPDMARSMGDAGRHNVISRYSWDRVAADMEELYHSVKLQDGVVPTDGGVGDM